MFADFSFYKNLYGGTLIPEPVFMRYSAFASNFVSGMISTSFEIDTDIKMAVCHVAEIFFRHDSRSGIASENNDGYSISYDKASQPSKLAAEVVAVYLGGKGLMYRGIG